MLETQSLKSIISIPMKNGDELLGFIGFDSIKQAHSYTDKEKNLLEVFSQMLVNVIERKRHDGLLVRQEEKYRNIITNMNLGIIEVDENENILYANQSFCDISGYNQDEIKKLKATRFLHSSEGEFVCWLDRYSFGYHRSEETGNRVGACHYSCRRSFESQRGISCQYEP